MSDQDVKSISSATGKFQALQHRSESPRRDGTAPPVDDNKLPVPERTTQPDLGALAAKLNTASQSIGRDLRFRVDMDSGRSVIQVLDRETGEIIREIPPEKAEVSLAANGDMQLRLYDRIV